MRALALLSAVAFSAGAVSAQEIVGKGSVDGYPTLLFDDGSWRYDSSVGTICGDVLDLARFCANPKEWHPFPASDSVIGRSLSFRHNRETYGYLIVMPTGPDAKTLSPKDKARLAISGKGPRLSMADLEARFMERARRELGYDPMIIVREKSVVAGREGTLIAIGTSPVEAITFYVGDDITIVASTTARSTLFTQEHREAHLTFLAAIRLKDS